jgi:hypothetical protein
MRAYPTASGGANGATAGIYIISDRKFESNVTTNVVSLTGDSTLVNTIDNNVTSQYGEYIIAFQPITNYTNGATNGSGHIQIYFDGYTYTSGGEATSSVYANLEADASVANVITSIDTALTAAGTLKNSDGDSLVVNVFGMDTNFDGTDDTVGIAANALFGIADTSRVKIYKYNATADGTFRVEGTGKGTSTALAFDKDDGDTLCSAVNVVGVLSATGVECLNYTTDNNYSILFGDTYAKATYPVTEVEYLELGQATQVNDVTTYSTWDATKGPIGEVYGIRQLTTATVATDYNSSFITQDLSVSYNTSSSGKADGNLTLSAAVSNLSNTIYWADDMPGSTSPIIDIAQNAGKKIVAMLTAAQISDGANSDVRWLALDATKTPDTWYDKEYTDTQELLWTEKEKGYWVKLDTFTPTAITLDATNSSYTNGATTVQSHFNNTLDSSGQGETTNHINRSLKVVLEGLSNENTYTVGAVIGGVNYPLRKNAQGKFELRVNDTEMGFTEIEGTTDYSITLTASDGFGNYFADSTTYEAGFTAPTTPSVAWNADGKGLTVSATNAATYELHEGNISDYAQSSSLVTSGAATAFTDLTTFTSALGWDDINFNNKYYDIKIIAKSSDHLYSDIQAIKYVPAYINSSILESVAGSVDALPYSYKSGAQLTSSTGVQLRGTDAGTYTLAYEEKSNASFLGNTIATYYQADDGIMQITFDQVYDTGTGDPFYVEYNSRTYYGEFNASATDPATPHKLTEITAYTGTNTQAIIKP